ncbi:nucleoside permease [Rhizosphaericola mali]|uniref:Nucleoside permease n=1 Tax=Rhizosphaericola mali TaxID=2545455 RepID=A0A5P2G6Y2_9BACT|nr:nucleoside permease [Rhizosphaericola mali]QES87271.1 nucleoside permease [Rhizosphaericola mali]
MQVKYRLIVLHFFQFFVWGAWLITVANYWFGTKHWDGTQFGAVFGTMGIASVFMPTLTGIIADRWMNAEKLYGILHILYAISLFYLTKVQTPGAFFAVMLISMCFYMPTIALGYSISYSILKKHNYDIITTFPPIRVWGTVGFIAAMWVTNLTGSKASVNQFYIASAGAFLLGIYGFTLIPCKPDKAQKSSSLAETLGLTAFKLFANKQIALFFIFSMFLGAALQLTNAYGDVFLSEFSAYPSYADSFVVKYSTIIMSISQISETLFILAIPFFLKKFGIKKVMLISILAWVLRFGFFGYGNPTSGLWMIIMSCIVYGMAFDFFNISGSLFIESSTTPKIRSSAQGLFMMMTNGFGAIFGSLVSGKVIDMYFTKHFQKASDLASFLKTDTSNTKFQSYLSENHLNILGNGDLSSIWQMKDWHSIWICFAAYALVLAILFMIFFKETKKPEDQIAIMH